LPLNDEDHMMTFEITASALALLSAADHYDKTSNDLAGYTDPGDGRS